MECIFPFIYCMTGVNRIAQTFCILLNNENFLFLLFFKFVFLQFLASILGASTRSVGDRAYGYILLDIPGTPADLAKAVSYLSQMPDVMVQVEAEYEAKEAVME